MYNYFVTSFYHAFMSLKYTSLCSISLFIQIIQSFLQGLFDVSTTSRLTETEVMNEVERVLEHLDIEYTKPKYENRIQNTIDWEFLC